MSTDLVALAVSLIRKEKKRPESVLSALYLLVAGYLGKAAAKTAFSRATGWLPNSSGQPKGGSGSGSGWTR